MEPAAPTVTRIHRSIRRATRALIVVQAANTESRSPVTSALVDPAS
jgi:hypothetical protein